MLILKYAESTFWLSADLKCFNADNTLNSFAVLPVSPGDLFSTPILSFIFPRNTLDFLTAS